MSQWSDDVIAALHQNTPATAMAINISGNLALLGSRRNLTLIDLNTPKEVLKRVNINSKWDVHRVKWNPFVVNQQYFLTTYNQYTDLWHYNLTTASRVVTFAGHTRAISDVDWSATDPNLLATCSLDQYIYLWDIRETKRPKLVTSTVSGASCVRWNKFDQNILASSHDGNIRIWDVRNGKAPIKYITAHVSSINCLDWSPKNQDELASASQDSNISFWNTSENPRVADFQIHAQYPVWRAEYTPFGTAVASLSMRNNFRETPFSLWNYEANSAQPIHVFNGHTDVVLDFQWRKNNDIIWQLVTWSKDQILRLWPIDYSLFISCGGEMNAELYEASTSYQPVSNSFDSKSHAQCTSSVSSVETQTSEIILQGTLTPDVPEKMTLSSSPGGLVSSLHSRDGSNPSLPDTLEQEFRLLNACLPNLTIHQMDKIRRVCTVALRTTTHYFVLGIDFPELYPHNKAPKFTFLNWSDNLNKEAQEKLLLTLHETAQHHVRNNRACLEPCLRQLTTQFREMVYHSEVKEKAPDPLVCNDSFLFPSIHSPYRSDLHNIPFPRTSGARFCGAGYLVFFTRPTAVKGFYTNTDKMPRSLVGLLHPRRSIPVLAPQISFEKNLYPSKQTSYNENEPTSNFSVGAYFYKNKKRSRRLRHLPSVSVKDQDLASSVPTSTSTTKRSTFHHSAGKVVIVDLTRLMPISRKLAVEYMVPEQNNFSAACEHNKEKAASEDMPDLVQLWSCVSYLPNPSQTAICNEYNSPFQALPLGRFFLSNLLEHYSKLRDVQTLAMLACTFDELPDVPESQINKRPSSSYASVVKRSMSHQNFDVMLNRESLSGFRAGTKSRSSHNCCSDSVFGLHKSSSESKFPDQQPSITHWISNMIARSPSSESSISKYFKTPPESPQSDDYKFCETEFANSSLNYQERWHSECRMLDNDKHVQYDAFKRSYCSLLERWKANTKIAEIQKHVHVFSQSADIVFKPCQQCDDESNCISSKDPFSNTIRCVICQMPVKSLWSFCGKCYHGGHFNHLQAWFSKYKYCPAPSGCQCDCILNPG